MIAEGKYQPVSGIKNLVKEYTESTYKIDRYYRYFYFYFDKLEDTTQFEKIRELVENIYTNEYLNRITVNWNNELADADGETGLPVLLPVEKKKSLLLHQWYLWVISIRVLMCC